MAFKVLIPDKISSPTGLRHLAENGCEVIFGTGSGPETVLREGADCDAMLIRVGRMNAELLDQLPKLKVIGRHGVGYDNVDVAHAAKLGIWVTNAPLSNSDAVAEHTIAYMLMLARHAREIDQGFQTGQDFPIRSRYTHLEIGKLTLGIIGVGRIGSRVARIARGFGMTVLGFDPYLSPETVPEGVRLVTDRDELLQTADFVTVHCPANAETAGSLGAQAFALMKPTAYFINAARGEVMVEQDLAEALRSGKIAGAAVDVFYEEPPRDDNPLFGCPNIYLTPHCAAETGVALDNMGYHAAMGIVDVLQGKRPQWPVNEPVTR